MGSRPTPSTPKEWIRAESRINGEKLILEVACIETPALPACLLSKAGLKLKPLNLKNIAQIRLPVHQLGSGLV